MNISQQVLSDLISYTKYSRYIELFKRRETWEELVTRCMDMHIRKYPYLEDEIREVFQFVYDKKVLPSMRSLQFGGKAMELSPNRGYNCSGLAINHWKAFGEIMFLLLGGSGVGYSVQRHHVEKLPTVKKRKNRRRRYLIHDSIEGWADAVKVLTKSYFYGQSKIEFDYSDIRKKGTPLKTSGGKAPGPEPLKDCIHNITKIFDRKAPHEQLSTLEAHDICCYIADAVLAGGIRRAACLSLFSLDDEDMLTCKYGDWQALNPQRGRANNSVAVLRNRITEKKFNELWKAIKLSGSGEPGIYFTNDKEWLPNPCVEISFKSPGLCNLTTINASNITSQRDLNNRARAASFIGTLQAGFTHFHYLRETWITNAERSSLLGVSMTGVCSGKVLSLDIKKAAEHVVEENERVAKRIGINPAERATCVKPEGSSSLLLGCSNAIGGYHAEYYIRRITLYKNEPLYQYLVKELPELIEEDEFNSKQAYALIPIKAPKGAILRSESPIDLLERVKRFHEEWIKPGHRKGKNTHNVSTTVNIKDDEWDNVREWMWENRNSYTGLSVLPYDGGTYPHLPFEEIDKKKYNELLKHIKNVDLTKVLEEENLINHAIDNIACSGGACSL